MDKCPFKAGDTITAIETVGSSITKGRDYVVQEVSMGYVRIPNNAGQVGGWMPSRFKLAVAKRDPNQVKAGDRLICVHGNDDAIEGQEYVAIKDFVIPQDTAICSTVGVLDSKGQDVGGVFPWRFKLKEANMAQQTINVGDTLVVLRGKGTPNLPDGAEVNVLNVSGGNTSVQVLNTSGRKEWYGVERFQVKQASMIGKTMVVTKSNYPLNPGDTFVVTGQNGDCWTYDWKSNKGLVHPMKSCKLNEPESMIGKTMVITKEFNPLKVGDTFVVTGEETRSRHGKMWTYMYPDRSYVHVHPKDHCELQKTVVRKTDKYGNVQFEVGDRVRFRHGGKEVTITKVMTYDDTSQTLTYGSGEYDTIDNSSVELIQPETETNMTQVRTPTTKNPSGAIAGDTVLVEGVLTRGPDGDNEFVIKLGTKDAFVPATAIKSITKKVVVGPKFAVGATVKMNSSRVSYTDTRKRGTVLFEKNGVYFIEWTGGELGSSKETNSIKEQSLLAA